MAVSTFRMNRRSWIRLLILVLALTASRNNFPLRKLTAVPASTPSAETVRASSSAKKSESVVPSRRHVESRRLDWVKALTNEAVFQTCDLTRQERAPSLETTLKVRAIARPPGSPGPDYLETLLHSTSATSLPPPA